MSTNPLLATVQQRLMLKRLQTALGGRYAANVPVRLGTIVSASQVAVNGTVYDMDSSNLGLEPGAKLNVKNVQRLGAARYVPADAWGGAGKGGGGTGPTVTLDAGEGPGIDVTADAVGLGGDSVLLYDAGGDPAREYPATAAGLDAALAAAASGDVVGLPAGTIAGAHTVPAGVEVTGLGSDNSILSGAITNNGILSYLYVSGTLPTMGTLLWVRTTNGAASTARNVLYGGQVLMEGSSPTDCLFYAGGFTAGATDVSTGFFAAGVGSSTAEHGPHFVLRGNAFTGFAGQRGQAWIVGGYAGDFSGEEGDIILGTGGQAGPGPGNFVYKARFTRDGYWKMPRDRLYLNSLALILDAAIEFDPTGASATQALVFDGSKWVASNNVPNADTVDGEHAQKSNLSASTAPTTGDDSGDGYAVGSRWIDTTADKAYVCVDASLGAAVWIETGAGAVGAVDASDVTYTPTTATDWDSDADPGNVDGALDQLAERVDDLEAGGALADHDHSGDVGDGGQFDIANLSSGAASLGDLPTADGSGGVSWAAPAAVDAADVTYTPAVAADWDGDADPGDVDDALDQLAERVDDLEGAGGGHVIEYNSTPLTQRTNMNFTGDGVVASDTGGKTVITISGIGSTGSATDILAVQVFS